ncbi:hypothetical protein RD792_006118 [Penstemon davidsonii]|uniref:F-box domain-containing protein n=1 Tax=Penstemon davidsonii TaxID=160366 RepID=A0ABR0DDF9_9LAMI|nr:hypothetical protein RD792_006118 [Penstemon davidsonii]
MLEDIIYRLELEDSIRSLAVSKSWLAAAISVRISNKPPWHMVFPRSYKLYKFYDPSQRKSYWLELPELEEAKYFCRLPENSNVRDSRTHPLQQQTESELPPEMLEDIIYRLELEDSIRSLAVSKSWLAAVISIRISNKPPWHMVFPRSYKLLPENSNVRDSRTHPLQQQTESELPPEMLEDIIYRLELEDSIRSLAVSKSWLAAVISIRISNKPPWHMVFPRSYKLYKFYDPSQRKSYWLELPELEEAKLNQVNLVWMETKSLGFMSLFASLLSSHARVDLLRNMRDNVFSQRLPEISNVRDSRTNPLQQQTESELPPEMLENIIYRLELEDSIRSLAVSKYWLAAAIFVRISNKPTWHMVFPRSYKLYKFYDPSQRKSYWLQLPELEEAKV